VLKLVAMLFLKISHKINLLWVQWERETYKTGLRYYVFNVHGDKYIGKWSQ
jgi:hypothetical protein